VEVPAGTSTVRFRYWTPGLTSGLAISGASLAALLACALLGKRRRPALEAAATAPTST
jgi:hypothetical protein